MVEHRPVKSVDLGSNPRWPSTIKKEIIMTTGDKEKDKDKDTGLSRSQKKVRIPTPPPTVWHKDKSRYNRRKKHIGDKDE